MWPQPWCDLLVLLTQIHGPLYSIPGSAPEHLGVAQAPMVSEHNVGQPMEAIGVMDWVEVVLIL
jgi:hypothetical protein